MFLFFVREQFTSFLVLDLLIVSKSPKQNNKYLFLCENAFRSISSLKNRIILEFSQNIEKQQKKPRSKPNIN